jgi:hypothetical protein
MPKGHLKEILNGPIEIVARLDHPIGVNHEMNGGKPFVTLCVVTYRIGMAVVRVEKGYKFDGASIPRLLWWIRGFSPVDRTILAALVHDYCCDNPNLVERVIADAVFLSVLKASGVGFVRRWLMWRAVRIWSSWRVIQEWWSKGGR